MGRGCVWRLAVGGVGGRGGREWGGWGKGRRSIGVGDWGGLGIGGREGGVRGVRSPLYRVSYV